MYARGILAQCAIGKVKRFELAEGGALAIGSDGFRFDSNYAKGRTNDVVFAGDAAAERRQLDPARRQVGQLLQGEAGGVGV